MEFKKVTGNASREYAKVDEITKKELKSAIPKKWIVASGAGVVTLLYSSPKFSPLKIGVVFGCMSSDTSGGIID